MTVQKSIMVSLSSLLVCMVLVGDGFYRVDEHVFRAWDRPLELLERLFTALIQCGFVSPHKS